MSSPQKTSCCSGAEKIPDLKPLGGPGNLTFLPMAKPPEKEDIPCCGAPQEPPSSPLERPGYTLCHFVEALVDTPAGPAPSVNTTLTRTDLMGTIRARIGFRRNLYKIAPGLYAVGKPDAQSVVLVTANYKLTFDTLRHELTGLNLWLLVLDTRGINVWCAAGKGTFSTDEIARQVNLTRLGEVVKHRELILPQLAGPGVSGHKLNKLCGFKAIWGPIRALDIRDFLNNDKKATHEMRQVSFTLKERLVLTPVELYLITKPTFWILLALFLISGIGREIFSLTSLWQRGLLIAAAYLGGVVGGTIAVPALLPVIPFRAFALKGALTGLISGGLIAWLCLPIVNNLEALAMLLCSVPISSYTAMNFTGATPFTSPSGVEKEMRLAIPSQALIALAAAATWIIAAFV